MEQVGVDEVELPQIESSPKKHKDSFIITTSNWKIANDKSFDDCISMVSLSQAPESINLEDVVSLDTCVALQSDPSGESCKLEFKVTNRQKIARIAIVSEASVLEFFKESGEYATTVFAKFVDEFQDHAVYFAETEIQPASREASIKFTRTKNKGTSMWIYGVKLIVIESSSDSSKNMFDVLNSFISNDDQQKRDRAEMAKKVLESFAVKDHNSVRDMNMYLQQFAAMNFGSHRFKENVNSSELNNVNTTDIGTECKRDFISQNSLDLKTYIDSKFSGLEKKLMERIEVVEQNTNQKLDAILKKLEIDVKDNT